jgi:hypothetical protein
MSAAPFEEKEMTLSEALQLADDSIEKLYMRLERLALSYTAPSERLQRQPIVEPSRLFNFRHVPPIPLWYVNGLLERLKADNATRDRVKLVLLERISREFTLTPESG